MKIRSYKELSKLKTFEERYNYLKLDGVVGSATFGFDRYLNQALYTSRKWLRTRDKVILRDEGCDLGIDGFELYDSIIVHHINPLTVEEIENNDPKIYDLNNLICVSLRTHNAIHYPVKDFKPLRLVERTPGDTCPWR